ncbi:MAG: hypothetical protein MZV64_70485 [Ignavibacteriales bacterium]|nr:hypothetical protein [Ignavibacteriales bacterium]
MPMLALINKDPQNIVRINGTRCVGLSIYKETGFVITVKAVEDLSESLESVKEALPGYEFVIVQNQGKFIQAAIDEVQRFCLNGRFCLPYSFLYHFPAQNKSYCNNKFC